jgi:hypothetical protein
MAGSIDLDAAVGLSPSGQRKGFFTNLPDFGMSGVISGVIVVLVVAGAIGARPSPAGALASQRRCSPSPRAAVGFFGGFGGVEPRPARRR